MVVEYGKLYQMIKDGFIKVGMEEKNADQMAEVLCTAEARGVYSHGVQLAPLYYKQIESGEVNPNPQLKVVKEDKGVMIAEGDKGYGGIVFREAVDKAIERAKEYGTCTLVMTQCNHYGAGAFYVERAADAGMISYLYANGPAMTAPFGGAERFLSTNPYSFSTPAGKYGHVVLDMATTVTAGNKLRAAMNDGIQVPSSFGVDRNGRPCTDPKEILFGGALSHFGGPKGYGLAFMIAAVTGVLSGSGYMRTDFSFNGANPNKESSLQTFFMNIVDISKFTEYDAYIRRMEDVIADLKTVKPAEGFKEVFFPGEIENNNRVRSLKEGVTVHDAAYESVCEALTSRGVAF